MKVFSFHLKKNKIMQLKSYNCVHIKSNNL